MGIERTAAAARAGAGAAVARESGPLHGSGMAASVVDGGDLHVAVIVMAIEAQVLDPQVGKAHVVVEVGQVVFECPASDLLSRAIGPAISIRHAAVTLVEPLLVLALELVVQDDVLDAGIAFEETLDFVEVRLKDVRVVL